MEEREGQFSTPMQKGADFALLLISSGLASFDSQSSKVLQNTKNPFFGKMFSSSNIECAVFLLSMLRTSSA